MNFGYTKNVNVSLALLTHAPYLSLSVPSPQKKTFAVLICVFFFFLFPLSASDPLQAIAADIATAVGFLLSLSLFRLLARCLFDNRRPICCAWLGLALYGIKRRVRSAASCRLCWSPVQLANYLKCFKLFTLSVVKFYKQNKNICREPRRAHKTNGSNCYNDVVLLDRFVDLAASSRFP